jgi:hypothetical protein
MGGERGKIGGFGDVYVSELSGWGVIICFWGSFAR